MNGWIIIFALTATISGSLASASGGAAAPIAASGLFAFLSLLGLMTRMFRGCAC